MKLTSKPRKKDTKISFMAECGLLTRSTFKRGLKQWAWSNDVEDLKIDEDKGFLSSVFKITATCSKEDADSLKGWLELLKDN